MGQRLGNGHSLSQLHSVPLWALIQISLYEEITVVLREDYFAFMVMDWCSIRVQVVVILPIRERTHSSNSETYV
jgi:hypothetical protein